MWQSWNILAHVVAALTLLSAFGCTSRETEFPKGIYSAPQISDERWEVVFADQGRFRVTRNGRTAVEGQYASTANRIAFSNETGPDACGNETGTYGWKRKRDSLVLAAVNEPCDGRRNVMQRLVARK